MNAPPSTSPTLLPRKVPEILFVTRDVDEDRRGAELVAALGGRFEGRSVRAERMAPSDLEDAHLVLAWSWEVLGSVPHRLEILARARPKLIVGWPCPAHGGGPWTAEDAERRGELALLRRVPRTVATFDRWSERRLRPALEGMDGLPDGPGRPLTGCLPLAVDPGFWSPGSRSRTGPRIRVGWDDRSFDAIPLPTNGTTPSVDWVPVWNAGARGRSAAGRRDLFRSLDAVVIDDRVPRPLWVQEAAACGVLPIELGFDQGADGARDHPDGFAHPLRSAWATPSSVAAALEGLAAEPTRRAARAASLRAWMTTHGSWDALAPAWGKLFRRLLTPDSEHVVAHRRTLAIAAETAGSLDQALRHWHRVLTSTPLSSVAHAGLARVYRRLGQRETAFAFAQRAQALSLPGAAPARQPAT